MDSISSVLHRISNIQNNFSKYFAKTSQVAEAGKNATGLDAATASNTGATASNTGNIEGATSFSSQLQKSVQKSIDEQGFSGKTSNLKYAQPEKKPSGYFDKDIAQVAGSYNIPEALLRSVVKTESNFNPFAVSSKGALGLMQLMPKTAKAEGLENPFEARQNLEAGARHLSGLINQYDGDFVKALAAYNAGSPALVDEKIPPYKETHDYIKKILGSYLEYSGVR